ncbi:DUF305 domain-containing protein [Natronococcus wangiae]|uniref:DUF305 domain-containing protein n=1 Tax=Natronococcus wangiae TaxID=3068275 RepID=UPI00273F0FD8|nr:DUF305 domain-containing protein [Natronococcus sp. AD5]
MIDPTRRQVLCATGAASTAGFVGYTATGTQEDDEQDDTSPDEDSEFNNVDVMFMRMMIMHHEEAIHMAELVPERTDRQELLDLRTEIIEDQEAEIDLMCELLEEADGAGCDEVGGVMSRQMDGMMRDDGMGDGMHDDDDDMDDGMHPDEMEEMMPREHMMTHDDKRELRRAEDQEFDCLFVEQMARHHEGAVMMSEHVLDEGESQRVANVAEDIIEVQQNEIELMEEWQDDWDC